jgi:hypothetical protein
MSDKFQILTKYSALMKAWDNGASMSDMYHLILDWFQTEKPQTLYPELSLDITEWLDDAFQGKETNDLVEEFMFGDTFKHMHALFSGK